MNLKIKVCGMRDPKNVLEVAALHPDFMGFIFYNKSKRFVGDEFVLPQDFPNSVKRVGVFVNESVNAILESVTKYQLDFVQLHGEEQAVDCKKLKNKVGVIKAFSIDEHFDFAHTKPFVPFIDFFLFDTKSETYGGSGKTFDWNLLHQYQEMIPFFLSGGISENNVMKAAELKHDKLFALDVNSGVELSAGVKDVRSINKLNTRLTTL